MRPLVLLFMACPGPGPVDKRAPVDSDTEQRFDTDTGDSTHEEDTSDTADTDSSVEDTDDCRSRYWFADVDLDGYGDPDSAIRACEPPEGTVETRTDCDDTRADVFPGATEVCGDGAYNDCNDDHGADAWALCVTTETFSLAMADAQIGGVGDDAVTGITSAGDANMDGIDDVLLANIYLNGGTVYLMLGPITGARETTSAIGRIHAESDDDDAGSMMANAQDVNGDGYPDVLIGSPYPGPDAAYLLYGPLSGDLDLSAADSLMASFDGDDSGVGGSFSSIGDTNADGWDDVLLGAPERDLAGAESSAGSCSAQGAGEGDESGIEAGAAYIMLGPKTGSIALDGADGVLSGEDGSDLAGAAVSGPGDLNGDGLPDLVVGAPANCEGGVRAGAAYLIYSPTPSELNLSDADAKLMESATDGDLGESVAGAGDVNGDGTPDVLVGAPESESWDATLQKGVFYLFDGQTVGRVTTADALARSFGAVDGDQLGRAVASADDTDADGFSDVLVSAPYDDTGAVGAGSVYMLFGPLTGTHPIGVGVHMYRSTYSETGGKWLSSGDVNGDRVPDLLLGPAHVVLGGGAILSSLGSW